jgi:hypothetical protein
MTKYIVQVHRMAHEDAIVSVEAKTADDARRIAMLKAPSIDPSEWDCCDYEYDTDVVVEVQKEVRT